MKKFTIFILTSIAIFSLLAISCNLSSDSTEISSENFKSFSDHDYQTDIDQAREIMTDNTTESVTTNIQSLAQILALASGDEEVIATIVDLSKLKFDGESEILFSLIEETEETARSSSNTFRSALKEVSSSISRASSLQPEINDVDYLIDNIPYLTFSIPVHADLWDSYTGPIYIIPLRYDIDDLEIESLLGYTKDGDVREFSMESPPEFPVICVGINERINMLISGDLPHQITDSSPVSQSRTTITDYTQVDGTILHREKIRGIYFTQSQDLWPFGNPEIYLIMGWGDTVVKQYYPDADLPTHTWKLYDNIIAHIPNDPGNMYIYIEMFDEDPGSWVDYGISAGFSLTYPVRTEDEDSEGNITVTYPQETHDFGIEGSISIKNADDTFGQTVMHYWHYPNYEEMWLGSLAAIRFGYIE